MGFQLAEHVFQLVCAISYSCPDDAWVVGVGEGAYAFDLHVERCELDLFHFLVDFFGCGGGDVSEESDGDVYVLWFYEFHVGACLD